LELARVEGNSTVYSEQVRLKPFLSKLLGRVNEVSGEELELLIDFGKMGDAYSVQADPRSIEVIIRNLIENSIRHSKRDRVQVVVSLSECEGKCLLKYKDNGSAFGGPIRSLGELFKKGPGSKGAGVGLYLVRVLMARMEGSAAFKPEQDGFCVELAFRTGAES
jgi:signal transduction histidine kinase